MRDPRDILVMWTITYDTADYPRQYCVRGHDIVAGGPRAHTDNIYVGDSLEEARAAIPPGLIHQDRDPTDDPVIVESWF